MVTSVTFCGSDVVGVVTPRTTGKKEKELKIVEVSWIDAYTESSWAEYKPESIPTNTYGLLVKKPKEWTTLAMTKEKDYWGNLWYIPTKNVLGIKELLTIEQPPT